MKNYLITLLIFFVSMSLYSQDSAELPSKIIGHWEGGFIKDNSLQKLEIKFYNDNDGFKSLQILEEWHPQFGEFVIPVEIDSLKRISFNTGLGKAIMQLDENALEMVGQIEGKSPTIYVHLKKIPTPPQINYTVEEVTIQNGDVSLFGHLHQPKLKTNNNAIIVIGGRSCYAGSTKYDLYAKLLRQYGLTVLVFNKRGTGKSTGDCSIATVGDLADDVVACKNFLANHPNNFNKIGILGSSAGGWVMTKAEESTDFDFMIGIVGPATSVLDQQLQSMEYGFDFYKLKDSAKKDLVEYTNLMFDAKANSKSFERFSTLLEASKRDGWFELLDDTDIPENAEDINNLWVRRHNYDPKGTLQAFNQPFLAIYGEIDWIVPYKENVERLKEYFTGERKDLLNITIAYDAEHGTETKDKYVSLDDNHSYWRFFRISPIVQVSIIEFLSKYDFIEIQD
ncbi:alpha/beta hydrolase [Winogradskyella tangerina]|uniref:alpha/beta hydrolase n=1 Tax=Winogradskyella tangerina TaxID=2023240 RepID=UPI000DBE340C|nr:alpha/beta fold hydrolase [Winogradskyella tangerina]